MDLRMAWNPGRVREAHMERHRLQGYTSPRKTHITIAGDFLPHFSIGNICIFFSCRLFSMACHVSLFSRGGKLKKQPFSKFKKEKYPSIVFNIQDINESIFL